MESQIALIVLVVLGLPTVLAIWLIVRAVGAKSEIAELSRRLRQLEDEIFQLKARTTFPEPAAPPTPQPETIVPPRTTLTRPRPHIPVPEPLPPRVPPVPPPIPDIIAPSKAQIPAATFTRSQPQTPDSEPSRPAAPGVNWEQFLGVKGFAWLGGFALFLGVAFFIKYSFDNNLVSPALRVTIGFLA